MTIGQIVTGSKNFFKKMEGRYRNMYNIYVNISDILEDIPYLQECLVLAHEATSALQSLPSQRARGTDGILTEI